MKKNILFAGFVAVIAILAASCNSTPKVDAPKARFTYEVDGMTVTFTNASKDAETFAWEFGDGETSAEENPVHEYAEGGSYSVKLTVKNAGGEDSMTEEVSLEKAIITVDGDFSDWAAVPAERLATASASSDSKYPRLINTKWSADDNFIYWYVEYKQEAGTFQVKNEETGEYEDVEGWWVDPIDIYLNTDGDETTGSNSYLWVNSAADFLIEGFWSDNYESAGIYSFPADADQTAWAWEDAGIVGSTSTCDQVALANGNTAIEGKIMIAMLPGGLKGLKVGVFCSNTAWGESGCLPETTEVLDADGVATTTPSPLLVVPLP